MSSSKKSLSVWVAALLITGNMIGAGILALPVRAGVGGVIPALLVVGVVWIFMTLSAVIIAKIVTLKKNPNFDLPSIFEDLFGVVGKWFGASVNLLILYGVLVAYLSAMTGILTSFTSLDHNVALLIVFFISSGLTIFGLNFVSKFNSLLMFILWGTFFALLFLAGKHINGAFIVACRWKYTAVVLPSVVAGFHFHNIVPFLCSSLNWNEKSIFKAIFLGSFLGLIMNIFWVFVSLGTLPLVSDDTGSLMYAYIHQLPATVPLAKYLNSNLVTSLGQIFALIAILTSFMSNGLALCHFLKDLLLGAFGRTKPLVEWVLTLSIPLIIVCLNPELFLGAIDAVGGIGMVIIFGMFPGIIAVKLLKAEGKYLFLGKALLVFFSIVLLINLLYWIFPPSLKNLIAA